MSFYRSLLAAVAAIAIASPVFADDTANAMQNPADEAAAPAQQVADNSSTQPAMENKTDDSSMQQKSASTDDQSAPADTKVNVNKASAKELMKIKGMTASKAKAIVAYRKKHGDFKSLDDLKKVKGFAKMKSDKMKAMEDQMDM